MHIHYQWYKSGDPEPTWKSTYVTRTVAPNGKTYLVGSGEYNMRVEHASYIDIEQQAFATLRDKSSPFFSRWRTNGKLRVEAA